MKIAIAMIVVGGAGIIFISAMKLSSMLHRKTPFNDYNNNGSE